MEVVAKWPGSNHDSFISLTSAIHDQFERGKFEDNSWLLGNSGYSPKQWLMTPFSAPFTSAERKFNVLHRKTCCLVERAFGVLKHRWRILDHTRGSLCYSPAKGYPYTSQKKHFPENHLLEKHFSKRSFSRINICLKSHLPE